MGTGGLPDIYTQSPRAPGPRAEGVYIRQTTSAHGITIIYQLMCGQTSTIIASWSPSIYMGLIGLHCGFKFNDENVFMMSY